MASHPSEQPSGHVSPARDMAPDGPVWHTPLGPVVGWRDGPVDRATGVRYATAERGRPPVAVPPWDEPVRATSWAPACPQPPMPFLDDAVGSNIGDLPQDEDCLRVSVTAPAGTTPDDALPVMVWIHGGSYASGAGDAPFYDPAALVSEQRVVVVNVTYRLGLLGYLGDGRDVPANLGLLDQIEALRWVRGNIAAFGGDPENVTVFGQSAGGDAVAHLMISHGARGLFRRAIIQSAPFGLLLNRSRMSEAMAKTSSSIAPEASVDQVIRMQQKVAQSAVRFGLKGQMPYGVQYGHHPLPQEAELDDAWREAASRVDVLVGHTTREAALFTARIPPLLKRMQRPGGSRWVERGLVAPFTRKLYGNGSLEFARRHHAAGGRGYHYELAWRADTNPVAAGHIAELPLLFPGQGVWEGLPLVEGHPWVEVYDAGARLRAAWAAFARGEAIDDVPEVGLRVRDVSYVGR